MSLWKRKNKEIDLVLSSSGVRAPCFIGGLTALKEKGFRIKRIAGSSGGAIIASAYALGMTIEEMREVALATPYDSFRDFRWSNLLSMGNPSVYTGDELDKFYQGLFGNARIKDFEIDCKISVVTIIGRKRILIDKESYPELLVWRAVRMSSTIPFIFPYLELDDEPVTDGGLVSNMFDIFPNSPRSIVGLRPRADHVIKRNVQDVKAYKLFIGNYLKIIAEYFLDALDNQHVPQIEWNKTVIMPTEGIGSFSFYLQKYQIEQLIECGYRAVVESDLVLSK